MLTVNEALVLTKAVRERISELRTLRSEVSKKTTMFYGDDEKKLTEPQYSVIAVDTKITELEIFLLTVETAIKKSNAITEINVTADIATLLSPIK